MGDEDKIARHTFTRVNKSGLLEVVDEDSGEVVAVQKSYDADLFADKRDQLLEYEIDGKKVLVERGINLDSVHSGGPTYSNFLADIICQRVAEGDTFVKICAEPNMPSYGTLTRWRRQHTHFDEMLEQARADRAEFFHDSVIKSAEEVKTKDDAVIQKAKMDAYKWAAEKGNPDKFGNRTKISGDKGAPLQLIIDTGVPASDDKEPEPRDVEPLAIESKDKPHE